MGRKSRAKSARRQTARAERISLRVTVISQPASPGSKGWAEPNELPLIRSAVLYADTIELLSQRYFWAEFTDLLSEKADLFRKAITSPDLATILEHYQDGRLAQVDATLYESIEETVRKYGIDRSRNLEEFRRDLAEANRKESLQDEVQRRNTALRNGLPDIRKLKDAGVLQVSESGLNFAPGPAAFHPTTWEMGWWMELLDRVESGGTCLLLDKASETKLSSALGDGLVRPSALFSSRSTEAAVGTGLIARLPAFPEAPIDELLDLRSELEDALIRYRAAAKRLSRSADDISSDDRGAYIDSLWTGEVEPAILAIKEQLHDHSLVRELARYAGQDLKYYLAGGGAAGLAVGISASSATTGWAASAVSLMAPSTVDAIRGWRSSLDQRRLAERADMFYLYEANRRLS